MSAQKNPLFTGLLVAVPILFTIAIAIVATKCTEWQVSKALDFLAPRKHNRTDTDATLVDSDLGVALEDV